ncbi:MAG: DUF4097 family beta strand repeat-containing protein [Terriglobales bacterium]
MESAQRAVQLVSVAILATAICASAEVRKEFRFTVGPQSTISITNQYGPISVKPGAGNQVVINAILHSDRAEIDQSQSGNRIDIVSHLFFEATPETGRVDYEVLVPADASVSLRSTTGPLHAEGLHGDVTLEGSQSNMDVAGVSDAHVHIKTLNGLVTLNNIRNGHVEVTSVSGDVVLHSVSGPLVQVNSTSGKIRYDGDFGNSGEYYLASHTGDIEASAPNDASIDVTARSVRGQVENDFLLEPKHTPFVVKAGSAFAGTMNKAASSVRLFSFSGNIHLKKR